MKRKKKKNWRGGGQWEHTLPWPTTKHIWVADATWAGLCKGQEIPALMLAWRVRDGMDCHPGGTHELMGPWDSKAFNLWSSHDRCWILRWPGLAQNHKTTCPADCFSGEVVRGVCWFPWISAQIVPTEGPFFFFFWWEGMWDLSSPTRAQTCAPCGNTRVLTTGPPETSLEEPFLPFL